MRLSFGLRSSLRKALAPSCFLLCCSLFSMTAEAQPPPPTKPAPSAAPSSEQPSKSSAQWALKRESGGGADGQTARSRARGGDCAGALPSFDAAIENTVEPSLRRDRGLCHEKLGHPFPAMEDYRAYLLAAPDAADADQIRQRLAALEGSSRGAAASATRSKDSDVSASGSINASASGSSAKSSSSESSSESTGKSNDNYEYLAQQEKLAEAAETSPLRFGKGVVIGAFVHLPRFFVGDKADSKLAYGVGLALRYSLGRTTSIISEIGAAGIGPSGAASSQSGPLLFGGIELRLPVARFATNQILLRGGLGYERPVVSGTRAVNNYLLGRFAVGFRHVFGPAIALELLADGGPVFVSPENGDSRLNGVLGGSVAFVVGF